MTTSLSLDEDLLYPESDGKPMSESTEQYRWIVMIKENLEILFVNDPMVFIAADLFWYPAQVKTPPAPQQAPDVMVVFGRPKGMRRSYQQWKEQNVPAQVVFEILSASNKTRDGIENMDYKFLFYQRYGVEEYYIYDPDEFTLQGWQRRGDELIEIPHMSQWISPRLGIRFEWQPRTELVLYGPDGQRFLSSVELSQRAEQAQQQAEQAQERAQQAQQQAEQAQQQAEQAQQQAQQAQERAQQAEQALRDAGSRLLAMGLSVEQVAETLGLPVEVVQSLGNP